MISVMLRFGFLALGFLVCGLVLAHTAQTASPSTVQIKEKVVSHIAEGTFEVKLEPASPGPAEGLTRMKMEKQIHGGLEAVSRGEMLFGGDPKTGTAGYVALETVTGKLDGKSGSFALQHNATMTAGGQEMQIVVTPGSGTGEMTGLVGRFKIAIEGGRHSYAFDYTLPAGN